MSPMPSLIPSGPWHVRQAPLWGREAGEDELRRGGWGVDLAYPQ